MHIHRYIKTQILSKNTDFIPRHPNTQIFKNLIDSSGNRAPSDAESIEHQNIESQVWDRNTPGMCAKQPSDAESVTFQLFHGWEKNITAQLVFFEKSHKSTFCNFCPLMKFLILKVVIDSIFNVDSKNRCFRT